MEKKERIGDLPVDSIFSYDGKKFIVVDDSTGRTNACEDCDFKGKTCYDSECRSLHRTDKTTVIFKQVKD